VPDAVREIAWKAQTRLCQRYRHIAARGKLTQVVVAAIGRELAGFVWSIACITSDTVASDDTVTALHDEVTARRGEAMTTSEEVAQQIREIVPTQAPSARHGRRSPQTRAASVERSRTG
jgi:hypothetical protein